MEEEKGNQGEMQEITPRQISSTIRKEKEIKNKTKQKKTPTCIIRNEYRQSRDRRLACILRKVTDKRKLQGSIPA